MQPKFKTVPLIHLGAAQSLQEHICSAAQAQPSNTMTVADKPQTGFTWTTHYI